MTYFLRWTCTALNTSSRFSTTKSPSRMQCSPGCGGCGLGCSADASMDVRSFPNSVTGSSRQQHHTIQRNLPFRRHRPHVLRAASAFRSQPQDGFREPRGFRLSELFDWLRFVPPSRRVASLSVLDAPKKNSGETRSVPCGVALGLYPPCVSRSGARRPWHPGCSGARVSA